jgi:heptosyltransferase-2
VTKQIPVHKTVEMINKFLDEAYSVALIGGDDDVDYCRRVRHSILNKNFTELCGKLSPLQSYAVIKRSKALVCTDSAAQHIGAAAGVPIVLVYGSTDASFGFYPLTSMSKIVEISGLECRPCTDHGRTKCPLGHFKCMEEISADVVFNEVQGLIG